MSKKIPVEQAPLVVGTLYPPPYDAPCRARRRRKLGDAAGLTQFGVNLLTLPPGAWSSQRHFHSDQDEFVYVLKGRVTLVTDDGPEILVAGDAVGFKAGEPNGHCLQNHTTEEVVALEIGTRTALDSAHYPDIDLVAPPEGKPATYTHKDGRAYADIKRRGPD
jgi:uncharacterized cupin superfamily protein